jgi:hypothetical protein
MLKNFFLKQFSAPVKSEDGNIIVALVFGILIVSTTLVATAPVVGTSISGTGQQSVESNLNLAQYTLVSYLKNPEAWNQLMANNPILNNCLYNSTYPCPVGLATGNPLAIYKGDGKVFYDFSSANQGFDLTGTVCNNYGTSPCVFAYLITWVPTCPPNGNCILPPITINMNLQMSTNYSMLINTSKFNFAFGIN